MVDTAGEALTCQHCGIDIRVPADRSRFQAAVAHFEARHVSRPQAPDESGRRGAAGHPTADGADEEPGEEPGISD